MDATEGVAELGLDRRAPLPIGPEGAGVPIDEGVMEGVPSRDVSVWGVSVVEGAGVDGGTSPGFFLAFKAARRAAPRPPGAGPPLPPGGGCPLEPSITTFSQGSLDGDINNLDVTIQCEQNINLT